MTIAGRGGSSSSASGSEREQRDAEQRADRIADRPRHELDRGAVAEEQEVDAARTPPKLPSTLRPTADRERFTQRHLAGLPDSASAGSPMRVVNPLISDHATATSSLYGVATKPRRART